MPGRLLILGFGLAGAALTACMAREPERQIAVEGNCELYNPTLSGPLVEALVCHRMEEYQRLLETETDLDRPLNQGRTLLEYAAQFADTPIVLDIVARGAQIDPPEGARADGALSGALSRGAVTGDWTNYETLLARSQAIEVRTGPDRTTLPEKAVALGYYNRANELLDLGYDRELSELLLYATSRHVAPDSFQGRERQRLRQRLSDLGISPGITRDLRITPSQRENP